MFAYNERIDVTYRPPSKKWGRYEQSTRQQQEAYREPPYETTNALIG